MIPTFIGISLITFLIIQLAPGSPLSFKIRAAEGMSDAVSQEVIEQTKALYGLDKPIPVQYVLWLGRIVRFDFGNSYVDQRPVSERILEAVPVTLQLNLLAIFFTYLFAIPLGVFSAVRQRSMGDYALTLLLFMLYSMPSFWVAMLLIMFLGGGEYWDVFPVVGLSSTDADTYSTGQWILDRIWHMVLPVFCLTYGALAGLSRYMRTGMLETIRQDYIRTARAFGFSEKTVIFKYAMRNSLMPVVTLMATLLPAMIGGSVIIEMIFSIPGMGLLAFNALLAQDYPMIMGVFTVSTLLTLAGLILRDLVYALVDPRVSLD